MLRGNYRALSLVFYGTVAATKDELDQIDEELNGGKAFATPSASFELSPFIVPTDFFAPEVVAKVLFEPSRADSYALLKEVQTEPVIASLLGLGDEAAASGEAARVSPLCQSVLTALDTYTQSTSVVGKDFEDSSSTLDPPLKELLTAIDGLAKRQFDSFAATNTTMLTKLALALLKLIAARTSLSATLLALQINVSLLRFSTYVPLFVANDSISVLTGLIQRRTVTSVLKEGLLMVLISAVEHPAATTAFLKGTIVIAATKTSPASTATCYQVVLQLLTQTGVSVLVGLYVKQLLVRLACFESMAKLTALVGKVAGLTAGTKDSVKRAWELRGEGHACLREIHAHLKQQVLLCPWFFLHSLLREFNACSHFVFLEFERGVA